MTKLDTKVMIGPFGESAMLLLDMLFPNAYQKVLIADPTFSEEGRANIGPQFMRGDYFVLSSVEIVGSSGEFCSDLSFFSESSKNLDTSLDIYRYEHAFFGSRNLSILTAWAQAEYAIIAFKNNLLEEYGDWLKAMQTIGVVKSIS